MKVLVTGGAGFIGSHLVDQLIQGGIEVHILDNLSSGHKANIHPLAFFHQVDICSKRAKEIIIESKPEIVFHLAAQADVHTSILEPVVDADVNISGTINVLTACIEAAVKKVIFASTSAVYGNKEKPLISETDESGPESYYGLSKLTAESYIQVFNHLHKLPYTILRFGNVYGPRQLPKGDGGVIAVFADRLKKGLTVTIHGDGEQTRDFIYVTDVVNANIAAIDKGDNEILNISTATSTSINDILAMLSSIRTENILINYTKARTGDIKHSCLNNKKAKDLLDWQPKFTCFNGLKATFSE